MRLGQLARKLGINPSDIIEFLTRNELPPESSNARLNENQLDLVFDKYGPIVEPPEDEPIVEPVIDVPEEIEVHPNSEEIKEKDEEKVESEETALEEPRSALEEIMMLGGEVAPEVTHKEQPKKKEEEEIKEIETELDPVEQKDDEVIRPQLVELPGLKVVGKIDLPEPKPVELKEEVKEEEPKEVVRKSAQSRDKNRTAKKRNADSQLNPIEAQRRKEAKFAKRKKEYEAKKLKAKRKKNYQSIVSKTPQKSIKRPAPIIKEEPTPTAAQHEPKKRTGLGKLWNWLAHAKS